MSSQLSSSIEQRIEKNGLIIYSKGIDFFSNSKLKRSQLNPFGSILQKQYDNYSQTKSKYYPFYLYYKAESDSKAIDQFKSQIEFPNQILKEAVTKEHLLLLYNIIEFEDKFKTRNAVELEILLTQLMKFDSSQKTLEEFLLFTYYLAILNFYLKKYDESNQHFMTVIIDINEEVKDIEENPFVHYLMIKNNLFMWRISQIMLNQKKQLGESDSSELIVLSKDMYTQFKTISPVNGIKMGLIMFDLYFDKHNYAAGYQILNESYQLIKSIAFNGNAIEDAPELYLQIIAKLAYFSVFLSLDNTTKLAKKLQKKYLILEGFLKNISITKKRQYAFCVFILNNITQRKDHTTQLASSLNDYKALLNQQDYNYHSYLVNLYAVNGLEQMTLKAFTEQFDASLTNLRSKTLLSSQEMIQCFFCVYNKISMLTKNIISEANYTKVKESNALIRAFSDCILNYFKALNDESELFQLPYIRILFIKIAYCRCYIELFEKQFNRLNEALNDFDQNKHIYVNMEQNVMSEYATIIKLKGDLEFKQENYKKAANLYQDSLNYLRNHKMKALVYYNLGTCYYCLKDIRKAKNTLNLSLREYQRLSKDRPSNIFENKITKIELLLKYFE